MTGEMKEVAWVGTKQAFYRNFKNYPTTRRFAVDLKQNTRYWCIDMDIQLCGRRFDELILCLEGAGQETSKRLTEIYQLAERNLKCGGGNG